MRTKILQVAVSAADKFFVPVEQASCLIINVQRPSDQDHCSIQAKSYMKKNKQLQGVAGEVLGERHSACKQVDKTC